MFVLKLIWLTPKSVYKKKNNPNNCDHHSLSWIVIQMFQNFTSLGSFEIHWFFLYPFSKITFYFRRNVRIRFWSELFRRDSWMDRLCRCLSKLAIIGVRFIYLLKYRTEGFATSSVSFEILHIVQIVPWIDQILRIKISRYSTKS